MSDQRGLCTVRLSHAYPGWHLCPASRDHWARPQTRLPSRLSLTLSVSQWHLLATVTSHCHQPLSPLFSRRLNTTKLNSSLPEPPCWAHSSQNAWNCPRIPNSFHCPEPLPQPPFWIPLDPRLPQIELSTCYSQMPQHRIHQSWTVHSPGCRMKQLGPTGL